MTRLTVVACALLAACGLWQASVIHSLRLRVRLTEQRAEAAEADAASLQSALLVQGQQISALQTYGERCESARAQDAAETAARRAIMGLSDTPAPAGGETASPRGGALPPEISGGGDADAVQRQAVAAYLNRPL